MVWIKIWNRKHTLQDDYFGRFLWFIKNPYYRLKNIMFVPVGKSKADFYCQRTEWNRLMHKLAEEMYKPDFLPRFLRKFRQSRRQFRAAALALSDTRVLRHLSNKQLLKRYVRLKEVYKRYPYFFFSPWAANEIVAPRFEKLLKRFFPKNHETIFSDVTTPIRANLMEKQKRQLVKYAMQGKLKKKLNWHAEHYQWLGVYSQLDKPLSKKFFLDQVKGIGDSQQYLISYQKKFEQRRKAFRAAIQHLHRHSLLERIGTILNEFAWLRTERVDVWREVLYLTQPFYRELERRMKLSKHQAPHLSYQEVIDFFRQGHQPEAGKIVPEGLIYYRRGRLSIIRDLQEANAIFAAEIPSRDFSRVKRIKGYVASAGKARGCVKVIMVPGDCAAMKKGNILVSNMTHPDYVFGIKKASAIITDEGGISCHAAIISRELGIPCVIGTKIATQVLKDGDLVEVDAEKGIIRKL